MPMTIPAELGLAYNLGKKKCLEHNVENYQYLQQLLQSVPSLIDNDERGRKLYEVYWVFFTSEESPSQ